MFKCLQPFDNIVSIINNVNNLDNVNLNFIKILAQI
jgi:hypothetical protein